VLTNRGLQPRHGTVCEGSGAHGLSSPLDAGSRYENEMNTLCFSAGDHKERINFRERRAAEFSGSKWGDRSSGRLIMRG